MKILVVDDESTIADILVESFEDEGAQAKALYSGNHAIKYLKSNSVDLILSDIKMPDGTGIDLLEYVTENKNSAALMFMTGYSEFSSDELVSKGAIKVFTKPIDLDNVIDEIIGYIKK
jgi:DNA-binding NtrC family response regulator